MDRKKSNKQTEIEQLDAIITQINTSKSIDKEQLIADLQDLKREIIYQSNVGNKERRETTTNIKNTQKNSEYLKYISNTINDLIWITDNKLNLTFITDSVVDFFGYTPEEFFYLSEHNSTLYCSFLALNNIFENNIHERKIRKKDGSEIWIEEIISPQYNEEGVLTVYVGVLRMINRRKYIEQKYNDISLSFERAKESKTFFWANISHELRTPLNAIMGFTEVLRKKQTNSSNTAKLIEDIDYSGKNLLRLVNDILDLSKLETGALAIEYLPCNIYKLVLNLEQVFKKDLEDNFINFHIQISSNVPEILLLDSVRLQQILFNLISNAIKFTPQGDVYVILEGTKSRENCINLIINVIDNGIGIDEDQLELIFEPFKQREKPNNRKYTGTGLGLSITKKLTTLLNGKINVTSTLGKGSTFELFFPNVNVKEQTNIILNEIGLDIATLNFKNAKVLLVDDIKQNRDLLKGILRRNNLILEEAENGKQAIELATKHLPKLIIMDICMPEMDGIDSAKIIKKRHPEIIVILISAFADMQEKLKNKKYFDYYIPKPYTKEIIVQTLSNYLPFTIIKKIKHGTNLIKKYNLKQKGIPEEAINQFNKHLVTEWERVKDSDNFSQYITFAENVVQYGEKYNIPEAVEYGKKLINFVDDFDIDKIYQTLSNFKAMFQI